MRQRCTSHDPAASEPVLSGPDHAAAAIRLSAPPSEGQAVVVLLCDADHRLLLAITVENAPPASAPRVVDLVLAVAETAGVAGIVIGFVRERLGQYLSRPDTAALAGLVDHCAAGNVAVLDVLLVGPRRWRSVYDLAAGSAEDQHGDQ